MTPIRSNLPIPTPRPQRPEARAAQQAFFQAAVNQQATVNRAAQEPIRAAAAVASTRREPLPGEEASRYLRPGSLLDIKV